MPYSSKWLRFHQSAQEFFNSRYELQQDKEALLSINTWQLPDTRCSQAIAAPGEFKKPVYESKFTKRAEETSFVNSERGVYYGTWYSREQKGKRP